MKQLEDFLHNIPKPNVKVDGFRQRLRRNLLTSNIFQKNNLAGYRRAFFLSTSVATVFAAILVWFIYQPVIPGKVHYALMSDSSTISPTIDTDSITPGYTELYKKDKPTYYAYDVGVKGSDAEGEDLFEQMLSGNIDKEVVRYLAEQTYKTKPVKIEPVLSGELYSINRFKLDNGIDALVYTQVPARQASYSYRESY